MTGQRRVEAGVTVYTPTAAARGTGGWWAKWRVSGLRRKHLSLRRLVGRHDRPTNGVGNQARHERQQRSSRPTEPHKGHIHVKVTGEAFTNSGYPLLVRGPAQAAGAVTAQLLAFRRLPAALSAETIALFYGKATSRTVHFTPEASASLMARQGGWSWVSPALQHRFREELFLSGGNTKDGRPQFRAVGYAAI